MSSWVVSLVSASIVMAILVGLVYAFLTHHRPFRPNHGQVQSPSLEGKPGPTAAPPTIQPSSAEGTCPNCGAVAIASQKFCTNCGQSLVINAVGGQSLVIDVVGVLNATLGIIRKAPVIVLPVFMQALGSALLGLWVGAAVSTLGTGSNPSAGLASLTSLLVRVWAVVGFGLVVGPLVSGMYPTMVEDVSNGRSIGTGRALRKAVKKYPSILGSNILVAILVLLASLLLLVPGIIVATWYYYTTPAIVLENRGALEGMSASKRFARNKKWATFLLLLIAYAVVFLESFARVGTSPYLMLSSPYTFVINLVGGFITGILMAIFPSYTYLRYAVRQQTEIKTQVWT